MKMLNVLLTFLWAFLALITISCERPIQLDSEVRLQVPQSLESLNSSLSLESLSYLSVQISGPNMEPIRIIRSACVDCSPAQTLDSSINVSAPSGADRVVQVLAVYESPSGLGTIRYGDTTKTLKSGADEIDISLQVLDTASIPGSLLSGRYLTDTTSGPTGLVEVFYQPLNKPRIQFAVSEIVSGWFEFPVFPTLPLTYQMKDSGLQLFSSTSQSTLTPGSLLLKIDAPIHYLLKSSPTRIERAPFVQTLGFFGDPAFFTGKTVNYGNGGYTPPKIVGTYSATTGSTSATSNSFYGGTGSYSSPSSQTSSAIGLISSAHYHNARTPGRVWHGIFESMSVGGVENTNLSTKELIRRNVSNMGVHFSFRVLPDLTGTVASVEVFRGPSNPFTKRNELVNCSGLTAQGFQNIASLPLASMDGQRMMRFQDLTSNSSIETLANSAYVFCPKDITGKFLSKVAISESAAFLKEEISKLLTGPNASCYINTFGELKCWGSNSYGPVGVGDQLNRDEPTLVNLGLTDALQVVGGDSHTCALLDDGTVKCWGSNNFPIAGNGGGGPVTSPVLIQTDVPATMTDITKISMGFTHVCALSTGGAVYCWGTNTYGQLGDGTTSPRQHAVTAIASGAIDISAGQNVSCAVINDGTAKCWGKNDYGAIGDGTTIDRNTPVIVSAVSDLVKIDTSGGHTCSIDSSGDVKCWGLNSSGQIGDGTSVNRLTPVSVGIGAGVQATELYMTSTNTCIKTTVGLKCSGAYSSGPFGLGHTLGANVLTPLLVHNTEDLGWEYSIRDGSPCAYKPNTKFHRCLSSPAMP